ncbi:MAG: hypothetical protein ABH854_04930 [Candidatus Diapherotrites archaeon]|nr:hypothetical protein [Candidatus Micrarchaeota archaeon]MBU1939722.1 hypothetical protein [Candidatus Micrarchaeota archaeon]
MGVITMFLVVLIGALGIGNGLLYITKPRGQDSGTSNVPGFSVMVANAEAADIAEIRGEFRAMKHKVDMAHSRIGALESAVAGRIGTAGSASPAGSTSTAFEEKLRKLDHFRANTNVELQAMKEILLELQKNNITVKAKKFEPRSATDKGLERQMHNIIYRSAKPAAKTKATLVAKAAKAQKAMAKKEKPRKGKK